MDQREAALEKLRLEQRQAGGVEPNRRAVRGKAGVRGGHAAGALPELERLIVRGVALGVRERGQKHGRGETNEGD